MISGSYSCSGLRSSVVVLLIVALLVAAPDEKSQGADKAVRSPAGKNLAAVDVPGNRHRKSEQHKGSKKKIKVSLCIPPLLEVSSQPIKISFDDIAGPGVYDGDKVAEVSLSTNTTDWSLICETVTVTAEKDKGWTIPPERIHWELTRSEPEQSQISGFLGPGVTLLRGLQPATDLQISIAFSFEILPTDPKSATTYNLHIGLMGKVNDE